MSACGCQSGPPRSGTEFLDGALETGHREAFDPHKWLGTPLPGGCLVARDPQRLNDAFGFAEPPAYIRQDKARLGDGIDIGLYGPELTRGFNAFKVFFSLLAHGRRAYAASIQRNVELARYLDARVDARPDKERMSSGTLSISCFSYVPTQLRGDDRALDALNERIVTEVQIDGRAFCSNAIVRGGYVLPHVHHQLPHARERRGRVARHGRRDRCAARASRQEGVI